MKNLILAFCCLLMLASCQKEFSIIDPTNNGNNNGGNGTSPSGNSDGTLLLTAYKINAKNDTITTSYNYDANSRIIEYLVRGKDDTTNYDMSLKFTRDTDGKITKIVKSVKFKDFSGADAFSYLGLPPDAPVNTIVDVHYPAGSKDFDYATETTDLGTISLIVKQKYTYSNGKISKVSIYQTVLMSGTVLQDEKLSIYYEYTYTTSGNVASLKLYTLDPSAPQSTTLKLIEIVNYTYNDKKSSIPFSNEYFLWQQEGANSTNFLTVMSMNDDKNKPVIVMEYKDAVFNNHDMIQACNMVITSDVDPSTPPSTETYKCTFYYK